MTHQEFIDCYRDRQCMPHIYPLHALRFMISRNAARRVRSAFWFWVTVWLALIALLVWQIVEINVFNAVVLVIFIIFLPSSMVHYSANYIITKSLHDADFYVFVRDQKVMHVEDRK